MFLKTFDPSRYGAPPKRQRVAASGAVQHGLVKPLSSGVAETDLTSTPGPDQPTSSVASSTVSDISNHAAGPLTHPTELYEATKTVESKVLKPKSGNKLLPPGFDPYKYGMPPARANRSLAQDEASVKADIGANGPNLQAAYPAASTATTSLKQRQGSAPIGSAPHLNPKSLEHTGQSSPHGSIVRSTFANFFTIPLHSQFVRQTRAIGRGIDSHQSSLRLRHLRHMQIL